MNNKVVSYYNETLKTDCVDVATLLLTRSTYNSYPVQAVDMLAVIAQQSGYANGFEVRIAYSALCRYMSKFYNHSKDYNKLWVPIPVMDNKAKLQFAKDCEQIEASKHKPNYRYV